MLRFRLSFETIAVYYGDGSKGQAVVIPAGTDVFASEQEMHAGLRDHSKFISVEWDGKTVSMFLVDLVDSCFPASSQFDDLAYYC